MKAITKESTTRQSKITFKKWCTTWDTNADRNKESYRDCVRYSKGRDKLIILSFGPSFKCNANLIKKNNLHYTHDIICVDKALPYLLEIGIIPSAVVVADGNLVFDNVIKDKALLLKYINKIHLFCAVISHHTWSSFWSANGGNFTFYINKDAIGTHKRYIDFFNNNPMNGPIRAIMVPAAINVANAAYVLATLIFKYRLVLLGGFDYSFSYNGEYYGTDKYTRIHRFLKGDKKSIDNHIALIGLNQELVHTSQSMLFSSEWLTGFVDEMEDKLGIETINISGRGILRLKRLARLKGDV